MNVRVVVVAMLLAVAAGAAAAQEQTQETQKPPKVAIAITDKGFTPAEVTVAPKTAVELVFTRTSERTCATEVVVPSLKIKKPLPLNEAVSVVITPEEKDITFSCGMNMLRGKLVVK